MTKIEVELPDEHGPGTPTIGPNEHHPAADDAMRWFLKWKRENIKSYFTAKEAIASSALSGNRLAEICWGTIERLETGQPVSDRYLLGLVWMIREMEEGDER